MEISLKRAYFPEGTNGEIRLDGKLVCHSIELPWLQNQRSISCIPEGVYQLTKRYTAQRGWHLLVQGVPGRSRILVHTANHAKKELKGCIAPVTELTQPGQGNYSRLALKKFEKLVFEAIDKGNSVVIKIHSI